MRSSAIGLRVLACILALPLALGLSACVSITPVQPWEKGNLAKPDMAFDADPLDKLFKEYTYSSKVSALGGSGVGGGGCGCN